MPCSVLSWALRLATSASRAAALPRAFSSRNAVSTTFAPVLARRPWQLTGIPQFHYACLVKRYSNAFSRRPRESHDCNIRLLGLSVYMGSPLSSLRFTVAADSVRSGSFDAICGCERGTALRAAADCSTSCDGAGCCCRRAGGGGMLACCCRACSKAGAGTCCRVCCVDSWLEAPGVLNCCPCSLAGRGCSCMSCSSSTDCSGGRVSDV